MALRTIMRLVPDRLLAALLALCALFAITAPARASCADAFAQARRTDSDPVAQVPYFFGLSRERAQAMASDACVKLRFSGPSSDQSKVVAQSVAAGRPVPARATVVLRMAVVDAVTVPSFIGLSRDAAAARADASGLKPLFYGPRGTVAAQSRPAGQTVARGSFIQLQVAAAEAVAVPDFVGRTRAQAAAIAAGAGLQAEFSGADDPQARVVGQNPAPRTQVPPGAVANLELAAARLRVPDLIGRSRAVAQAIAARRGLALALAGDDAPAARVARQSPPAGAAIDRGGRIQAVMALAGGPAPAPGASQAAGPTEEGATPEESSLTDPGAGPGATTRVPDLVGKTRAEVRGFLATHELVPRFIGDASADAEATAQEPAAGESVATGTTVDVTMAIVAHVSAPSRWPWLAGGAAVALAGGAVWLLRPKRPPIAKPRIGTAAMSSGEQPPPVSPVTYVATIDQGRPTVRLASEPAVAARALAVAPLSGGQP